MFSDRQDAAMLWKQEEQVLDEMLTTTMAIQQTYSEKDNVIWKKHETLFTTSLIFTQHADVDRSAVSLIFQKINSLEHFKLYSLKLQRSS